MAQHELHAFDYVNHSYEEVRDALLADPLAVLQRASATGLRAQAGPLELGAEIEIEILGVEEAPRSGHRKSATISIAWKAAHRPGLFPTMRADLLIYPLTATETQLELAGLYDPPFGVLGDAIDAAGMSRLAEETVTNFIQAVAGYLRNLPPVPAARAS